MNPHYTLGQLVDLVGGRLRGDGDVAITGVGDLASAGPNEAAWVSNPRYASKVAASRAGVVLVPADFGETPMPAILCERVDRSVALLLGAFAPEAPRPEPGVHASAVVHETAHLAANSSIGPHVVVEAGATVGAGSVLRAGVFIGHNAVIGDDCTLWPHVVVRDGCRLGNRVTIHANAVIGGDGFGFYMEEGCHRRVPHIGRVILEDDVEIGACSCVDRAKFGDTIVGEGTKVDNLVQVAHNVHVGRHCVLAAQVGISGSVRIGDYCVFGGKAGSVDNVSIGDRVQMAGAAVIDKDIPDGKVVSGSPAQDHRRELRERASVRRLPAVLQRMKELQARVERLEASAHDKP